MRRDFAVALALAVAWFALGLLALRLLPAQHGLAAVWPPSGIALGALLLYGLRVWPGIALGSVALGFWVGLAPTENLALTAGNVLEAVVGARLALWAAGGEVRLSTLRGVLSLLALGVVAGTGIGALVCTLLMEAGGRQTAAILDLRPWAAWLGNAMGALLVAPVVLAWGRACGKWTIGSRPKEAAALAALAVIATLVVFSRMSMPFTANPVPYLLFPLFFWAAIRFGIREVAVLLLVVGMAAVVATCNGLGPFTGGDVFENLISLYLFLAVAVVPTLVLAALVAERTAAQEGLAASERNYRLLVENQTELVIRLDSGGRVLFASPSLLAFLSAPSGDIVGEHLSLPVHDEDRDTLEAALRELFGPSGQCRAEVRLRGPEGDTWFAWSGKRERDGSAAVLVGRDVTGRRRAEAQAKAHLEQLAHVTRVSSMGEMASAIAHEVNQPLTAIQTFADASIRLLRSGPEAAASVAQALERIAGEASRAGEIIRRTRRFVRNEPGQPVEMDVNHVVAEVIRLAAPDAREAGIAIQAEAGAELPCVLADPIQIQQVLLNLVRNAVEAINGAGGGFDRRIEIRTSRRDDEVEIRVGDSGPGLAEPDRLFEPFYSTKAEGMGIGLAISRSLIEAHGGRLTGESQPGRGALFRVRLPIPAPMRVSCEHAHLHH